MSPHGVSTGRVRVGRFTMVVGRPGGTVVSVARRAAADPPAQLVEALEGEPAAPDDELDLQDAVEDAGEVTSRVERAVELFTLVAQGRLDAAALSKELDALLSLLRRLDRGGRFDEVLRLARGLHGVLALTLRWAALVEALQIAARAAEALADVDAHGWVAHEVGSLLLGAEDAQAAERELVRARELRAHTGDAAGLRATDHNLVTLRRALGARAAPWSTRTALLTGGAVLLAGALVAAVVAPALDDGGSGGGTALVSDTTATSDPTTSRPPPPPPPGADRVAPKPTLELAAPTRDGYVRRGLPVLRGRAGTDPGDAATVQIELVAAGTTAPAARATVQHEDGAYRHAFSNPLPTGSYTAVASQRDGAGNRGRSDPVEFRVDTDAPSVTISTPAPGAFVRAKLGPGEQPVHPVAIAGSAGTAPGDQPVGVSIYAGAATSGDPVDRLEIPNAAAWSREVALPFDLAGTTRYTVRATQRDAAGNAADPATTTFTLGLPSPD